jgi:hypothetical protein
MPTNYNQLQRVLDAEKVLRAVGVPTALTPALAAEVAAAATPSTVGVVAGKAALALGGVAAPEAPGGRERPTPAQRNAQRRAERNRALLEQAARVKESAGSLRVGA